MDMSRVVISKQTTRIQRNQRDYEYMKYFILNVALLCYLYIFVYVYNDFICYY